MAQDMKRRTKSVRKRRFPSADFVQKKNVFVQISEKSPDILLYGRARREILFSSLRPPLRSTGTLHLRCSTRQESAASAQPAPASRQFARIHKFTNRQAGKEVPVAPFRHFSSPPSPFLRRKEIFTINVNIRK